MNDHSLLPIILLPVFPKQQTFLCHPIQDLRQRHDNKYSDQTLIILNAIMCYSTSVVYTATLQALCGHFFFFLTGTQYLHNKMPITQMAMSDKMVFL